MSHKHLSLALSVALVLSASGCASLKGKRTEVDDVKTTQTTPTETTTTDATNNAETSGLNSQGGLNANGLGENTTSGTNGQNTTNTTNTQVKNVQNGSNGEISMADLLTVRLVHFDYDSSDLSNADYQTLQAHAQYLSQNPTAKVLLTGHADERGTREYNMALGERRANAVQAFLNSNGAKSNQLDTVSFGKEIPLNQGHDESAWAENRRVEIVYKAGAPK